MPQCLPLSSSILEPPYALKPFDTMNHESIATVVIATLAAMLSAVSAALMPTVVEVTGTVHEALQSVNVMDDARLRLVCICGSLGGALLSVLLFPLPRTKPLIAKLFASGLAGMMFSPMIVRWDGLTLDTDTMLFVSGMVALLSYSMLQMAVPLLNKGGARWLGIKMGRSIEMESYDVADNRSRARRVEDARAETERLEP
jgi:hypothetical protein